MSDTDATLTSVIVERHPSGYPWSSRFPDHEVVFRAEGGAVYSARGEEAYWLITDEGTLADLLDPDDADLLTSLIKLEKFDDHADWRAAIEALPRPRRLPRPTERP